jgi:purine-binding chemotaxis protein CheW
MDNKIKSEITSYLTFKIGEEIYAANVKNVVNIVELSKITKVPCSPEYMLGIVNLRGMVLPVVDARIKFGLKQTDYTVNTCILVLDVIVNNKSVLVGALVDAVKEVIEIDVLDIKEPPTIGFNNKNYFITGVFKKNDDDVFVMIVDLDSVFSTEEIIELNNHAGIQV